MAKKKRKSAAEGAAVAEALQWERARLALHQKQRQEVALRNARMFLVAKQAEYPDVMGEPEIRTMLAFTPLKFNGELNPVALDAMVDQWMWRRRQLRLDGDLAPATPKEG